MRVNTKMIKKMGSGFLFLKMVESMRDSGKMGNKMAVGFTKRRMWSVRESGKMESGFDG